MFTSHYNFCIMACGDLTWLDGVGGLVAWQPTVPSTASATPPVEPFRHWLQDQDHPQSKIRAAVSVSRAYWRYRPLLKHRPKEFVVSSWLPGAVGCQFHMRLWQILSRCMYHCIY